LIATDVEFFSIFSGILVFIRPVVFGLKNTTYQEKTLGPKNHGFSRYFSQNLDFSKLFSLYQSMQNLKLYKEQFIIITELLSLPDDKVEISLLT
jgi:hypothetical protein